MAIISVCLVFYAINLSALLSSFNKEPLSDMTITVIGTFGAFAVGGYFTLTGVRDCSLNKHNIDLNKQGKENNDDYL